MPTSTTTSLNPIAGRPEAAQLALAGGTPVSSAPIQMISVKLADEDVDAAVDVMRSGMLAQGKRVAELEERFASMSDARHAIACANGTCALQLAYHPLIEPGDDVLVPAWTYIATASMIAARGANPVFCDADPATYNIDVEDAARRITPRTTAIAATHLYGNPANIEAIEQLAVRHGLSVIYDAAQAHLATYKGRGIGAFGDAVTYSFYPTKNMTTGEGGMLLNNDEELDATIRSLRSHGETEKYLHTRVGFNYRMTDLEAAIGVHQLGRLPESTHRRRQNAASLDKALASVQGLHAPTPTDHAEHVYHLYPVRVDEDAFITPDDGRPVRNLITEALAAEGVRTALHYPRSLTRQPVFEPTANDHPPVADRLARTLFCVPIHQDLTDAQISMVAEALAKVASALRA